MVGGGGGIGLPRLGSSSRATICAAASAESAHTLMCPILRLALGEQGGGVKGVSTGCKGGAKGMGRGGYGCGVGVGWVWGGCGVGLGWVSGWCRVGVGWVWGGCRVGVGCVWQGGVGVR